MKKKKIVLHLLASNEWSGAENVACTIIKNTKEKSYYCCPNGPIKNNLKNKNIDYIPLKRLSVLELNKIIKKYNIDIVHAHDFKASFIASLLDKNVKKISHIHCNPDFIKKWNIYTLIYSKAQKKFYKIFVVSNKILDNSIFKDKIIEKTIVLDNVVDPNEIIELSNKFPTKKYDLIFVGRLIDIKRPLLFIDIVKNLKKQNPDIRACMLGQGNLYEKCKEKIINEKLTNNIDLIGFQDNPFPYVKNSKVEVLTSMHEGLPMTIIEALILNVPVVNSGVDGLKILFKNHKQYICNDINQYVNCINKLLTANKKDIEKDCKDISKNYSDIKKYSKIIETIYNSEE